MFKQLKENLQNNFNTLSKESNLFYVNINRDIIWDLYLGGFSEEDRQSNNCNCCKSFLRQWGGIVAIIDNKKVSIWDNIEGYPEFDQSVKNVREYIHSLPVTDVFYNEFAKCGTDKNFDPELNVYWNHFYVELPSKFIQKNNIDTVRGEKRDNKSVLFRALNELTVDAVETVLELIDQNSLYRGKEFEGLVKSFQVEQKAFHKLPVEERELFTWVKSTTITQSVSRIRNSAIGTLLVNLSEGMDLDVAVSKYEAVTAPTNYKRTTALVTPRMVEDAKAKISSMGLLESLERRFANESDLSIQNILYVDKSSTLTDVFGEMSKDVTVNPRSLSKIETVTIDDFINKVLPNSKSVEFLLENNQLNNMVSLVTAKDENTPSLFKWDNNFSWAYTGGVTDSIKERVKAAGGNVNGELRVSLSWYNYDDLDLHVIEPNKNKIYFRERLSRTSGQLDVDMNAGSGKTREAVENIIWTDKSRMLEGDYRVEVNNYAKRELDKCGYVIQIECNGEVFDFEYKISPKDNGTDMVVEFNYNKVNGVTFKNNVSSNVVTKSKWSIETNKFHKVKNIMLSPNYWNGTIGNKHYILTLENCINDESPRPFFNEFLKEDFRENRKVFELMGSKLKLDDTNNQLSGVGFSETQKTNFVVRVEGAFKRTIRVTI